MGYESDEMADRHGFIVLYPDGYGKNPNDCRRDAPFAARKENVDDVVCLRALYRVRLRTGLTPLRIRMFKQIGVIIPLVSRYFPIDPGRKGYVLVFMG